jgi:hypothetical protein
MPKNWKELVTTSHLETVREIQRALADGNLDEAEEGLGLLLESTSKQARRSVQSQLIRLMKTHYQVEGAT